MGKPLGSGGPGISDVIEAIHVEVAQTSDYVDTTEKTSFIPMDPSGGALNYTPPTPPASKAGITKTIFDSTETASESNKITVIGTIGGKTNPDIEIPGGKMIIYWTGTTWIFWDQFLNLFNVVGDELRMLSPMTLYANAVEAGQQAITYTTEYAEFQNPDININDNGVTYGNSTSPGANRASGVTPSYSGGETVTEANMTDGDTTTDNGWNMVESGFGNTYMDFDLGAAYVLDSIKAYFGSGVAGGGGNPSVDIWGSNDVSFGTYDVIEADWLNATVDSDVTMTYSIASKTAYRYIRFNKSNYTIGGAGQATIWLNEIEIFEGSYVTTNNTIETETLSALTVSPGTCVFYDDQDNPIILDADLEVEYTTDGGSTWSTKEGVAVFLARTENIISAGNFRLRLTPVGDTRVKSVVIAGPSVVMEMTGSGPVFKANGVEKVKFDLEGKIFSNGVSINSRLDALESAPTQEVADITARDALTPSDGDIVKVLDAGAAVTKIYRWDDGGSQWNDITDISNADLDEVQDRIDALENNPTQEVADITARDALTPNDGDIVQVTDAGSGETKIYKWDDGGSQWNDITTLSGGLALQEAQAAQNKSLLSFNDYPSTILNTATPSQAFAMFADTHKDKNYRIKGTLFLKALGQSPQSYVTASIDYEINHSKNDADTNSAYVFSGFVRELSNESDVHYMISPRTIRGAGKGVLSSDVALTIENDCIQFSPLPTYNFTGIEFNLTISGGYINLTIKPEFGDATTDTLISNDCIMEYYN